MSDNPVFKLWKRARPRLLVRYIFRQNLYFVILILLVGTGVYLLTDLFERVDNFMNSSTGLKVMGLYYLVKTPMIISQILPAAFLIATLVQLSLMAKHREVLAMMAGGISPGRLLLVVLGVSLFWAGVQLFFSQSLGVSGERYASAIWQEQVKGREEAASTLRDLWFWNENRVIYLGEVRVKTGEGADVSIYSLSEDGSEVKEVIRAEQVQVHEDRWDLLQAIVYNTDGYIQGTHKEISLPIHQELRVLTALSESSDLRQMSIWQISASIDRLKIAGSNVESLRTMWHSKVAYAGAMLLMGLIAMALMLWRDNVYINVAVSLVVVFAFYTVYTVGLSAGQKGLLPPIIASWGGLILSVLPVGSYILWKIRPHWLRRLLRPLETRFMRKPVA